MTEDEMRRLGYTVEMTFLDMEKMKWEWVMCGRIGEGRTSGTGELVVRVVKFAWIRPHKQITWFSSPLHPPHEIFDSLYNYFHTVKVTWPLEKKNTAAQMGYSSKEEDQYGQELTKYELVLVAVQIYTQCRVVWVCCSWHSRTFTTRRNIKCRLPLWLR